MLKVFMSSTIEKILVALDHSESSNLVFDEALTLAKALNAQMMLVHVISAEESISPRIMPTGSILGGYSEIPSVSFERFREEWQAYIDRGSEMLQARVQQAKEAGVAAQYQQLSGGIGIQICDLAKTWDAEIVAIGRRGYSGLKEFIMGSVSNYVLHHAPCSVMIIHQ
jgi:nucleotide-binding universal stress UspA family protein